ncbi:MAG: hypothetical protein A2293_14350 [Elusimicrobia bacterium RIFOXYB2_FULL_49_7]|nr:MAG: hypothetical protein A2293_14350 [Elusimicrobia bacterium RIFOXYB2_FULL_49_7]
MKILLIQLRRLGDLLMTTPAIRAIKQVHPQASLWLLCEKGCAPAVANHPGLDKILFREDDSWFGLIKRLRHENFDVLIDFQNTPATARLSFLSGAKKRIGSERRGRSWAYHVAVPSAAERIYSAQDKARLLTPLDIPCPSFMPEYFEAEQEIQEAQRLADRLKLPSKEKLIALSPVSRREYKRFPLDRFAHLCDTLHEQHNVTFLPFFGPGEESFIREMITASKYPDIFHFPYIPLSFGALKPLLSRCSFYLGNDNGIRHMAIIAGLPTATVFGRPDPLNWTPPDSHGHFYVWGKEKMASLSTEAIHRIAEQAFQAAMTSFK